MRSIFVILALAGCQRTEPAATTGSAGTPPPQTSTRQAPVAAAAPTPPPADKPPRAVPPLPSPLPGKRSDLASVIPGAAKLAIGDVDGDGRAELVTADANKLRVVTPQGKELASMPVPGGCYVLAVADVDGKPSIVAGWGLSREHRDAPAKLARYRLDKGQLVEDVIATPPTQRAEVVAMIPVDQQTLLVAYYTSKYIVQSAYARHAATGWTLEPLAELRMATSYARGDVDGDGKPDLVVGRVYGEAKGLDGDAFVLAPGGARTPIPTTRGVHGLAIADGAIFLGDGWHQNYADTARGLLTEARHDATGFHSQLVEDTPGQFMIEKILVAKIDGKTVLVTLGSHYVRAYEKIDGAWRGLTIAGASRDIAVGNVSGHGDEIVVAGDKPEVIDLRGVKWP
ncbi:MAG: FG-GAP repeat domain-containing protein [Acidobacteriota bacterium]